MTEEKAFIEKRIRALAELMFRMDKAEEAGQSEKEIRERLEPDFVRLAQGLDPKDFFRVNCLYKQMKGDFSPSLMVGIDGTWTVYP
jgi:hypothetical protein